MALNVDLAPYERIIIANVSVRNGDRRARLTFETEAKFLREKDMLPASEAVHSMRASLYFAPYDLFPGPKQRSRPEIRCDLSKDIMDAAPSMTSFIAEIYKNVTEAKYYPALKEGKKLIKYEKELHGRLNLESA